MGTKSSIDVYYPSKTLPPSVSMIKENTAGKDGGVFHSVVFGAALGTVGCEIFIQNYNFIDLSKTLTGTGGIYHC
jgi:hypothetical protein